MKKFINCILISIYIYSILIIVYIYITKDYSMLLPDYILKEIYNEIQSDIEQKMYFEQQLQLEQAHKMILETQEQANIVANRLESVIDRLDKIVT